jgi:DnaJ-domain-containing protein 1
MAATILGRLRGQEPSWSGTLNLRAKLTRILCGLALGAALTGPAMAEEQLVMPFACRVAGGQVSLAPSAPQAYRIYGHPEHRPLTTCSPYDPSKCHNWAVHRFDLDCGGVRTSWHSVVAALSPILAESVGAPGDAYDERAYAPQGGARPYRPGRRIAFPRGFAPNPMNVARFEQTAPATADIPPPPKKPESTVSSQVAETAPEPEAAPSSSSDDAEATGKTEVAQKAVEPPQHHALQIEIESPNDQATGSLPKPHESSLWQGASMVFTLTLAALFALSATLFLGRRRTQTMPVPAARASLARTSDAVRESAADHQKAADQQQEEAPATRLRLWDEDWLPATTSEALDVLGVEPQASRDKIKSTVTRLRRALHPDYALDEEDRRLRERRLKQINVAWEIVSGKRRSLWLSAKPQASSGS